ncbi:Protein peak3, partial [Saguinus oedipus]
SMSSPEPPMDPPEPDDPAGSTQPTYSNLGEQPPWEPWAGGRAGSGGGGCARHHGLWEQQQLRKARRGRGLKKNLWVGEIRAHLLPSKACHPRTPGSPSTDPQPLPPPLPQKILTRTQSLPTRRGLHPSSIQGKPPRRPLLGSHSVDESQAEAGPAGPLAELTFGPADAPLRLSLRDLHSPEAVLAALAAQQLEGLRAIYARLRARLMGGHPGPCRPGHGFRLLDSSPCAESGDALYYRVVRVHEEAWHILVAKVPKPGADAPYPWGLELQASLSPHFNLQGLCGLVPEGMLPGAPWRGAVALAAEVPERTVAQWLAEACAQPPEEFAWAVALQLLQLSAALEFLEARGAALVELRPENLLLAAPRGCAATGPPRLLLADFGRVCPQPPGLPGPHAPQLGRLLRALLGLAAPSTLAAGLERLAAQLTRWRPSASRTRGALQALLWGPGPELRGRGAPLGPWLRALGPWLRVRRALLVMRLAERAAGGEAPGLEEWLCCEYLAEATESSMGQALALLWD